MMKSNAAKAAAVLAAFVVVFYLGFWQWLVCRVYVGPGETLVISAKFGQDNPNPDRDRVVEQGTKGVWKDVFGEGRYFYNPIEYKTETRPATADIGPEQVGFVESMSGESLKDGQFLAKAGQKGVLERPLTPGKWRLNPNATKINVVDAVQIDPGSVGVVTHLSGDAPSEG